MDLLAALNAAPSRGARACKLQKNLDEIPADTDGKDELLARVADSAGYPASQLTMTFSAIGSPVSSDVIADHRAHRCACYR